MSPYVGRKGVLGGKIISAGNKYYTLSYEY